MGSLEENVVKLFIQAGGNCSNCLTSHKLLHPDNEGLYICKNTASFFADKTVTSGVVCNQFAKREG